MLIVKDYNWGCNLTIVSAFQVGTWVPNNYSIFKIYFGQKKFNLRNFGNKYRQFLSRFSELWSSNIMRPFPTFYIVSKMGETYNVRPNYRIEKFCQLLNTCSTSGLAWSKRHLNSHQFLYFSLPYNFLKFWHCKQIISKTFFFPSFVILAIWQSLAEEQQIHPIYIFKNQNFLIFLVQKARKFVWKKSLQNYFHSQRFIC